MTPAERVRAYFAAHPERHSQPRPCLPRQEPPGAFKRLYALGIKRLREAPSKAELDYLRGLPCPNL